VRSYGATCSHHDAPFVSYPCAGAIPDCSRDCDSSRAEACALTLRASSPYVSSHRAEWERKAKVVQSKLKTSKAEVDKLKEHVAALEAKHAEAPTDADDPLAELQTQLVALQEASTRGSSEATALHQQLESAQRASSEAKAALGALEASSKAEAEALQTQLVALGVVRNDRAPTFLLLQNSSTTARTPL
jgi:DNA repair exonuclease SbcCD ATPase subunit